MGYDVAAFASAEDYLSSDLEEVGLVEHQHADPSSWLSPDGSECSYATALVAHRWRAKLPHAAGTLGRRLSAWRSK